MDETTKLEHLIVEQSFASPLGDDEYARVSSKLDDFMSIWNNFALASNW